MAARTPRRSFATPFVVTLAAAPACYVQTTPPPSQPQPQPTDPQQPHTNPPQDPTRPPIVVNPPRPQNPDTQPQTPPPQPPPQTPTQTTPTQTSVAKWTIFKTSDGCQAAVKTECPKGVMCNPPPPIKYACPDNTSLPLTIVSSDGGQTCAVEVLPVKCPEGAICNPPRPRQYPCPKR